MRIAVEGRVPNVQYDTECFNREFDRIDPCFFKATDISTGQTVGFSQWRFPCKNSAAEGETRDKEPTQIKLSWMENASLAPYEEFGSRIDEWRHAWMDAANDVHLTTFAVRPRCKKRAWESGL